MSQHSTADRVRAAAREAEREEDRVVLSTTDARQGSPKRANLRVLIVSMVVLAALGLALTVAYYGTAVEDHAVPAGNATQTPAAPEGSKAPEPAPAPQP